MKGLRIQLMVILDKLLSPIIFISALLLYLIRATKLSGNFYKMTLSRKIFNKIGVFPIIDDYYEPRFKFDNIKKSFRDDRNLPGINMNIKEQLEILSKFDYNSELLKIPLEKQDDLEFYFNNGFFEAGDAEYLYNIIRLFKPKNIIEIGSGYSTLMAINAIKENSFRDNSYFCNHICIEPYEKHYLLQTKSNQLLKEKVEDVNIDIFLKLQCNDILFIDSSHIIRPQGDVLLEYLEILPILRSGVLVHIHDIFTPKDYIDDWILKQVRFWNEQYLLEAFLTMNDKYRVIGALNFLKYNYRKELYGKCPILNRNIHCEPKSFWIVRN